MTTIDHLAARLGLHPIPDGDCFRLVSSTGVALFSASRRGVVGGGCSWRVVSVLDLAALSEDAVARGVVAGGRFGGRA